jgi:hypothetical protein
MLPVEKLSPPPKNRRQQPERFSRKKAGDSAAGRRTARRTDSTRSARAWPANWPAQTPIQQAMHQDHEAERIAIIEALYGDWSPTAFKAAASLLGCATTAAIQVNQPSGLIVATFFRCRQRLCPLCAGARSRELTERFAALMSAMTRPRSLVLTIKHDFPDLLDGIRHLKLSFGKLRRQPLWREHVTGGAYSLEVKLSPQSQEWHPHLHICFDGTFLPWKQLRTVWHQVTGNSEIVWLEPVLSKEGMARELAKYVSKPYNMTEMSPAHIREFFRATKSLRMFNIFGKHPPMSKVDEQAPDTWNPETFGFTIPRLVWLANAGVATALELAGLAACRWPLFGRYIYSSLGDNFDIPTPARNPQTGRLLPLSTQARVALDKQLVTAYSNLRCLADSGLLPQDRYVD